MAHSPVPHTRTARTHPLHGLVARPPAWTCITLLALLVVFAPAWSPGNGAAAQNGCTSLIPQCPPNEGPHIFLEHVSSPVNGTSLTLSISASDDYMLMPATLSVTATGTTPSVSVSYGSGNASMTGHITLTLTTSPTIITVSIQDSEGESDSATDTVTYTQPPPPASRDTPYVSVATHGSDARNLACAGCTNTVVAYTTPSYVSRDGAQALTLTYNSGRAVPRAYVQVEAQLNTSTVPDWLGLALKRGANLEQLTNGGTEARFTGDTVRSRLAAQVDVSTLATGTYDDTAYVSARWNSGTPQTFTSTVPVRMLVVNGQSNPVYGAGWGIAGLQRLHFATGNASTTPITLVDGSGAAAYFANKTSGQWTSPLGDYSSLTYDAGTLTYSRSFPDGTVATFNAAGYLTQVRDRWSNTVQYGYDTSNRLSTVTDAAGKVTTLEYVPDASCTLGGATNSLCSITTPGTRTTQVKVDASGNLVRIDDPDGRTAFTGTYDGNHKLLEWVGRLADTTTVHYDQFAQLDSVYAPPVDTGSGGRVRPTTVIRSLEFSTLDTIGAGTTARGRVVPESAFVRTTAPNGTAVTMRLHRTGNPIWTESRDIAGHRLVSTVAYDDSNRVNRTTSATGATIQYAWSGSRLTSVVDAAAGATQTMTYELYDQVQDVRLNGILRSRSYYSGSKLAPDSVRAYTGDTTSATNPVTRFTYNSQGRVLTVKDPESHTQTIAYQSTGFQNTQSVTANGHTTSFTSDRYGRDSTVTDPMSHVVTTLYDAVNRPTSATGPSSATVTHQYFDAQRTDTIIDPIGQKYGTLRNALGWVTSTRDPRGQLQNFAYDRFGRVTEYRNRRSQTIAFTYDSLGRVLTQAAGSDTVAFAYDPDTLQVPRWVAVRNGESIDTLFSDAKGRPTTAVSVRNGVRYEVSAAYSGDGGRSSLTARRVTATTWERSLTFGYNNQVWSNVLPDFGGKLTALGHNRDGALVADTLPTGNGGSTRLVATFGYTTGHQLSSTSYSQGLSAQNMSYSHDALERMTGWSRGPYDDHIRRDGTFDALGRLTSYADYHYWIEREWICNDPFQIDCPDDGYWDETGHNDFLRSATYTYDLVGNRTDHSATYYSGGGNRLNTFDGWTLTYDADGNVTQKSKTGTTQTFTWNAFGQLTQVVVNGVTTTYGYDGLGRRVRKTVNGTATRYLYDGDNLVVEMTASGTPIRWYSYYPGIDRPHAMRRESDGAMFYYLQEVPGHVRGLVSASNVLVDSYEYDPFGQPIATSESAPQPFRFAGREYDTETGLYFMRARYYDPALGRFLSEDPIGLQGGINSYAYAANDPVNMTDPFGLEPCQWTIAHPAISEDNRNTYTELTIDCPGSVSTPNFQNPNARGGQQPGSSPPNGGGSGSSEQTHPVRKFLACVASGTASNFTETNRAISRGLGMVGRAALGTGIAQRMGVPRILGVVVRGRIASSAAASARMAAWQVLSEGGAAELGYYTASVEAWGLEYVGAEALVAGAAGSVVSGAAALVAWYGGIALGSLGVAIWKCS